MRPVITSTILISMLTVALAGSAGAQNPPGSYRAAPAAGEVLSRAAMRIEVLVDSAALGGTELEIARITLPPGASSVPRHHRHGSVELLYVLSGELNHFVNGQSHRLQSGMVGIVRPPDSVAHHVLSNEPVRALIVWTPGGEVGRLRSAFQQSTAVPRPGDDLEQLCRAWIDAYQRGNAAALTDLYTEDAARMPYDATLQAGRSSIVAAYESSFATRAFNPTIALSADEVLLVDDLAIERGSYREILRAKAGPQVLLEVGKYVTVARLGSDGKWRYRWSMFNRDAPARPLQE